MKARVLVTGIAGFIASHVAGYLEGKGYEVHGADRFSYAGKIKNIAGNCPQAKLWIGDLKNEEFCRKLAKTGWDAVIHCAGNTHVDNSIRDPISFTTDNVLGTNQLLHAFEDSGIRTIVYSTDETMGSTPPGQVFSEDAPLNPSNAYAASKVAVEGLFRAYYNTFGMDVMLVRPCNVYGRGQHPEKAIPRFTGQCLRGEAMTVHRDGSGARDWMHTEDHAAAIRIVLEHGKSGEVYNLARGDEHNDLEVATSIAGLCGVEPKITFTPGRPGHDPRYWMNGTKIRGLGWSPSVPFQWGLKDAVDWTVAHQDYWDHDYVDVPVLEGVL